jgi:uncharacterized membrane protein YjjB (DUF3815 family)
MFSHLAQWVQPVLVNGVAGIVSRLPGGQAFAVMCFTVKANRIAGIDVTRDPDRLRRLNLTVLN